ncbi:hypothetical protein J3E07_001597 [Methanococcus voltae]|uniref:Uncharacterized protein n=1 Tax=Methanococcus voltae TaxID=2188 RepID=A0A8J7UV89_METVO|nr:hypothetical protein [Methanococcus voltae]MBP2202156.1 hypothetical protein [Methanococcus voltae]
MNAYRAIKIIKKVANYYSDILDINCTGEEIHICKKSKKGGDLDGFTRRVSKNYNK